MLQIETFRDISIVFPFQIDWLNASTVGNIFRSIKIHRNIELRDLSINLRITFFWDIYLDVLREKMREWETVPATTPTYVVFGQCCSISINL